MLLLILKLFILNSKDNNYLENNKIQDNYFYYYNNHLGYNDNYTLEEIQNMSYILHNSNNNLRQRKNLEIKIDSIDYRDINGKSFLPDIEDQGHCGSCVAYTVNYYIESLYLLKKNKIIDLSENDLFFCEGGRTCLEGWNIGKASYVAKNKGVRLKDYCEYNIPINKCYQKINKINYSNTKNTKIKIKNYIFLNNINLIKDWLIYNSPIMSRLNVYSDLFSYNGGIYTKKSNNYIADHSVLIVGFNDKEEYWIGMNSWGKHWGEEGFFRIKYGESGILPYAYVFTV